jgi:CubicO group peptidase (beta-lactamase class C family)
MVKADILDIFEPAALSKKSGQNHFMKTTFKAIIFVFAVLGLLNAKAQTHQTVSQRTKKVLDSTYASLIKKYKAVGLSLAIVDSGRIVYSMGYGFSDRENKIQANDKTIYRIGSCSKSFTSLSILQLQDKNRLNVDHSVKKYLPELKIESRFSDNNPIFINEMMCHVSGLPCDVSNGFFCDTPPDMNWLINELNKQTTMSPRRYKHAYSNAAYGLLGEVIARQGNTTYSNYVKQNIFLPLNMRSSYIEEDTSLSKNFAKAYVNNKLIKEPLIRDQAAGLIHSNVLDMGNYLLMFLNKGKYNSTQILSERGIEEMIKNQIDDITLPESEAWGYGLYSKPAQIKKDKDSSVVNIIQHGGDTYAYHADFGFIPELQVAAVVLTNADKGMSIRSASKLLKVYLKETRGLKLEPNYKTPLDSSTNQVKKVACTEEEIKGVYNFNSFVMRVNNAKKISFKQGPAKIVLKQKRNDLAKYSIKAVLFGFVPIKIKDQEFTFEKKDNKVYCKVIYTKIKEEDYIGVNEQTLAIPANWKKAYGKYKPITKVYPCTNCPYSNTEGLSMSLSEEDGIVVLATKAKSPDMKGKNYLQVVNNDLMVTGGIGRNTGETVKLLENGNVYFSGFEFKKED